MPSLTLPMLYSHFMLTAVLWTISFTPQQARRLPPANSANFSADDDDEEGFRGGKSNGDEDDDDDQQPGAGKVVQVVAAQRPFESPDSISSPESVDFDKLSADEKRKLFQEAKYSEKKATRQLAMVQGSLQDVTSSLRDVTGSNRDMSSTIRSQQDLQGTLVAQSHEDRLRYEARQEEINRRREEDRLRYEAQVQAEREHSAAVIREERQAEREHSAALIREERHFVVERIAPLLALAPAPAPAPIVNAPAPVASDAAEDTTNSKASATGGDAANTTSAGALPTATGTSATASALTRSAATPVATRLNTPARSHFSNGLLPPACGMASIWIYLGFLLTLPVLCFFFQHQWRRRPSCTILSWVLELATGAQKLAMPMRRALAQHHRGKRRLRKNRVSVLPSKESSVSSLNWL